MMDKKELKNLDSEALKQEVVSLKRELFNLKLNKITGQLKDLSQFKKLRVQIARALTYLNQKQQ
jgi:large subunit ribosomal protein L29